MAELIAPKYFEQNENALGKRATCLLVICLFVAFQSFAQPKAIASLQPERIETGDTTGLLIFISGLNTTPKEVDFSPWASIFPATNIIGRTEWRRSGAQWMRRFTLIAFDSATLELPPLNVRLAAGKPLETNELELEVYPTRGGREITDMAKIRDIRREPESWMDYWPWATGVLVIMGLLVWWLRKNRRKPQVILAQVPVPAPNFSPSEIALQKLAQLQQKQLWKNQQTKAHYAELSLILREFLETRYGIAALESTTREIQNMLKVTDFPPVSHSDLKELLEKTDLVKYAQSQPADSDHEQVLEKARILVTPSHFKKSELQKPPVSHPSAQKPNSGKYEPL